MATLTIRLSDEKHHRLKTLAEKRHISVNKLIEELSTIALTEFDAETHFKICSARGSTKRGLQLLNKLDKHFSKKTIIIKDKKFLEAMVCEQDNC